MARKQSHITRASSPDLTPECIGETISGVILELLAEAGTQPPIQTVADRVSVQVRTLQRRLEAAGLCYRVLLGDCVRMQALRELSRNEMSVSEISGRLGYSDPAHFVRAVRRWTGYPPIQYRREAMRSSGKRQKR